MDRLDLPLNGLRVFEAAYRQGSFTRAAIELRVTQAAVSHQIARPDVQLVARHGRNRIGRRGRGAAPRGHVHALHCRWAAGSAVFDGGDCGQLRPYMARGPAAHARYGGFPKMAADGINWDDGTKRRLAHVSVRRSVRPALTITHTTLKTKLRLRMLLVRRREKGGSPLAMSVTK